ncbi:MAG: AAA family ATPase [Undibacterium sp.]
MLFGFTGTHRSGKSTTAKKVAETLGITYYSTSTTELANKLGVNPVKYMTMSDRVAFQCHVLENHLEMIDKLPRPLIVDRTPIDFLSYMLCEFTMNSSRTDTQNVLDRAKEYVDLCFEATSKLYDVIFCLAPLDKYVAEEGKPVENWPYQNNLAMTIRGALSKATSMGVSAVLIENTDFDVRTTYVEEFLVARMNQIWKARNSSSLH